MSTPGQCAYEAFTKQLGGLFLPIGEPVSSQARLQDTNSAQPWDKMPPKLKAAWNAAATAART